MVTVILNGYKRGNFLGVQLESIKKQTLRPKEIMLWQNYAEEFDEKLIKNIIHTKSNKNFGVWARFAYALNSSTEYVCIFDDDTMPGKKWLENCYDTIQSFDGLLGTIGVKFQSENSYQPVERVGWASPNETTTQVDIVGHSWFFRREWLSTFWRELPDVNQSKIVGEDIHFSYTLKKYLDKNTYVPPHPKNDQELWGSRPDLAWKLGQDSAAISMNQNNLSEMSSVYTSYVKKGFKILKKMN